MTGLALAALAATASPARADSSCGSPLPIAPAGLPASVVMQTACGAYAVDSAGRLSPTDRPRAPWAFSPSRFRIDIRRDHVVLFVGGKLRWRSRHTFYKEVEDLGSVALGRRALAFSFNNGKLWVAPLGGVERAVAWNEWAMVWTKHGEVLAGRVHRDRWDLLVRRADGSDPRPIATKRTIVYPDEASGTVLYVSRAGNIVRTDGRRQTVLASLPALGLPRNPQLQLDPSGLIIAASRQRLVVLRHDGSVFASARNEVPGLVDQVAVAPGRVAFAIDVWDEGGTGVLKQESVFVLREGASTATRVLDEPADYFGCGWTSSLAWHGSWLLYWDVLTRVVALDTDGPGRVDLSATAQALPGGLDFAVWG